MAKHGKILTPFPGSLLKGNRVIIPKSAWIVSVFLHLIALIIIIISTIFPLHFSIFGSSKQYKAVKVDLNKGNLYHDNNNLNDYDSGLVSGIDAIIDSSTVFYDGNNYSLKNPSLLNITFVNILPRFSEGIDISRDSTICSNIMPLYPGQARPYSLIGNVILKVLVSEKGDPVLLTVEKSSGYAIFDDAALETIKRWVFTPAIKEGIPTQDSVEIKIRFTPDKEYAESF